MKKFIAPVIFSLLGIISFVLFNIIGSEIGPNGELIEPFFLIPLGAIAILIGVIWFIIALIMFIIQRAKAKNK